MAGSTDRRKIETPSAPGSKRKIPRCDSCGNKIWKRDQDTYDEIGLCQQCALQELEPLASDLEKALANLEGLTRAKEQGWDSYFAALLDVALGLYHAGWRTSKAEAQQAPDDGGSA
jgi:hypothetical protein